ncbi:MAG: flavoprotein [Phycisphaerae bacterium]
MTKTSDSSDDLAGYEVLVAVCGGIAAYKVGYVVSELVQRGAGVRVAMTRAARRFVGPMTFQALTGRAVLTSLWRSHDVGDVQHIGVTDTADLMLIAPATANVIGKIAAGIADDLVTTLVVSAASPVVLAAAMNSRMWANPIVRDNVTRLASAGFTLLEPDEGWLACRDTGPGRMREPRDILDTIAAILQKTPPKRGNDA